MLKEHELQIKDMSNKVAKEIFIKYGIISKRTKTDFKKLLGKKL